MYKIFLLLAAVMLMVCSCKNDETPLKGKVTVNVNIVPEKIDSAYINQKKIIIKETKNVSFRGMFSLWTKSETVEKDENNNINFSVETPVAEHLYVNVRSSAYPLHCYLEKGDSLSVIVESSRIIIKGNSIEARQNRFIQEVDKVRRKLTSYKSNLAVYNRMVASGFSYKKPEETSATEVSMKLEAMLVKFQQDNSDFSSSFIRFMQLDNKYFIMKYELDMPHYTVKTYHPFTPEDIQKLEHTIKDADKEEAILSLYYRQILNAYIDYLRINDPGKHLKGGKDYLMNEVLLANYVNNPLIKNYIIADNLMYLVYAHANQNNYIDIVTKYGGQWSDMILKEAEGLRNSKGKPGSTVYDNASEFPELVGLDVNGDSIKLSDYKGKWLYIDVWATWCGPCNFEIPYNHELEKRLKGYNVEFIGVSVDKEKDREKLLKMIDEKNMGGVQFHITDKKAVYSQLAIKGIPHFAIISPEGKLYMNKAPRPSSGIPERLLKALASDD